MKQTFTKFFLLLAFLGLSVNGTYAKTYIINKSGTNFSVLIKDVGALGSPNATLQNKINEIRTDVHGTASTIQFGFGEAIDIGSGSTPIITFTNTLYDYWGPITLTGKVTSACTSFDGIIFVDSWITIESKASITSTAIGGAPVFINCGTLHITDGAVTAVEDAIVNAAGTLYIAGTASVSTTTTGVKSAIYNPLGTINIGGGTISGGAGYGIYNASPGSVLISDGVILAKEGYAVHNDVGGTLTISGGIGFAYGTGVADVIDGNFTVQPGSSAVLVAWNKAAGHTTYTAGTSNDIFVLPAAISAVWENQGGSGGILGTLGPISGFIPIEGVTVVGYGIETITNDDLRFTIYPNPTSGELRIENGELRITNVEIFDVYGKRHEGAKARKGEGEIVLNISHLPAGIYFLRIDGQTVKVIKN